MSNALRCDAVEAYNVCRASASASIALRCDAVEAVSDAVYNCLEIFVLYFVVLSCYFVFRDKIVLAVNLRKPMKPIYDPLTAN